MKQSKPDFNLSQLSVSTGRQDAQSELAAPSVVRQGTPAQTQPALWRVLRRHILMCALCGLVLNNIGCADGFTGGGIPPGRSTILGRVVHADHAQIGVPNALVTITTTFIGHGVFVGRGTSNYGVYTDDNGVFEVKGIPTDKISSNVTVAVAPNDQALQSQKVSFALANGRPTDIIVALPPTGFPLNQVATVKLVQQSSTNVPLPIAQFKAQVLDAAGNNLGIIPTLIFDGAVAGIAADGTINVTRNPDVTKPVVGSPLGVVTATVDTHGSSTPPATSVNPILPVGSGNNGPGSYGPTPQ